MLRYSSDLHCAECDLHYQDATQGLFSFNSPIGACDTCRGFGRVIGIDYGLVVPDAGKSLEGGAVRPWQTPSYKECQDDLLRFASKRGIPIDVPWRKLKPAERDWVIEGEGPWNKKVWYGATASSTGSRAAPTRCTFACCCRSTAVTRSAPPATVRDSSPTRCCGGSDRTRPKDNSSCQHSRRRVFRSMPSCNCRSSAAARSSNSWHCRRRWMRPRICCSRELRTRLKFLCDVGLGYLTLDRQSRTLSGGEVQRINLTTALGTSLVNTLFVLDEPSIGLHPRDMQRVVGGHAAAARCGQHAARGRARSADHARSRSHSRPGPGRR